MFFRWYEHLSPYRQIPGRVDVCFVVAEPAVAVVSATASGVGAKAAGAAEGAKEAEPRTVSAVVSVSATVSLRTTDDEDCEGRLLARGWRWFRFPREPPLVTPAATVPGVVNDDKGDMFREGMGWET